MAIEPSTSHTTYFVLRHRVGPCHQGQGWVGGWSVGVGVERREEGGGREGGREGGKGEGGGVVVVLDCLLGEPCVWSFGVFGCFAFAAVYALRFLIPLGCSGLQVVCVFKKRGGEEVHGLGCWWWEVVVGGWWWWFGHGCTTHVSLHIHRQVHLAGPKN